MFENTKILERRYNVNYLQKSYGRVSFFYDLWSRLTETKALETAIKLAEIRNGQAIIDAACGTGAALRRIVKLNPDGINIGIDLSQAMLSKARKKLAKLNCKNCRTEIGDALNLPFKAEEFDRLFNNFMADLLPVEKFPNAAAEFYRVLKPGGVAVISTFAFSQSLSGKFWFLIAKNFPALLTGCRPVSFGEYLKEAGFLIEEKKLVTQNTFPAEVIKARK